MKNNMFPLDMMMLILSASAICGATPKTTPKTTTATPKTTTTATPYTTTTTPSPTGGPGVNLDGKMLTVSSQSGRVTLYPPYHVFPTPPRTTTRGYYPQTTTTPAPIAGWTVCLRFLADSSQRATLNLCPSCRDPLVLSASALSWNLQCRSGYYYNSVSLEPNIYFMSESAPDIWTRVCLTVDNVKKVVQLFRGPNMSVRKLLPSTCSWRGDPIMSISQFDGQMTDVQLWDYPLPRTEVINYMNYGPYRGSLLTWSDIGYSADGYALVEDIYEVQEKKPVRQRGKGRRRFKGAKPATFNRRENMF